MTFLVLEVREATCLQVDPNWSFSSWNSTKSLRSLRMTGMWLRVQRLPSKISLYYVVKKSAENDQIMNLPFGKWCRYRSQVQPTPRWWQCRKLAETKKLGFGGSWPPRSGRRGSSSLPAVLPFAASWSTAPGRCDHRQNNKPLTGNSALSRRRGGLLRTLKARTQVPQKEDRDHGLLAKGDDEKEQDGGFNEDAS